MAAAFPIAARGESPIAAVLVIITGVPAALLGEASAIVNTPEAAPAAGRGGGDGESETVVAGEYETSVEALTEAPSSAGMESEAGGRAAAAPGVEASTTGIGMGIGMKGTADRGVGTVAAAAAALRGSISSGPVAAFNGSATGAGAGGVGMAGEERPRGGGGEGAGRGISIKVGGVGNPAETDTMAEEGSLARGPTVRKVSRRGGIREGKSYPDDC